MSGLHALLSPSSAARWLTCTPSARLEEKMPSSQSVYADEGTLAHELGRIIIDSMMDGALEKNYLASLEKIKKSEYYNNTMHEYMQGYAEYVVEKYVEAQSHTRDAQLYLEKELILSDYIKNSFGTGDAGIVADTELTVIDLKYGKGIFVDADENKQMMVYALGWLKEFDFLYDIKKVKMIIYQPRMDSISVFEMKVKDLKRWAEQELKPKAALAWTGKGSFVTGDHCQFCRAKATCRAFAEYNLELAAYDFKQPDTLTDKEVVDILLRADKFKNWIGSVESHALSEAVNHEKKWPGMKLVEGRANRIFKDLNAVVTVLKSKGFTDEQIYNIKLKGFGDLEDLLGKKTFNSLLFSYIHKPPGAPALVDKSDNRPPLNSVDKAAQDFKP